MAINTEGPGFGLEETQYQVQGVAWQAEVVPITLDVLAFPHNYLQISQPQVLAAGRISADQRLRLPGNAVVRSPFPITVQAGKALWIRAGDVAEVRTADLSTRDSITPAQPRTSVTVDFGGLRTVAAVGLVSSRDLQVLQVRQWTGAAFAPGAVVGRFGAIDPSAPQVTPIAGPEVTFPSEIRTERLQVVLAGRKTVEEIRDELLVLLPDLPADVQLTIDGGPPVWSAPGPVRAGAEGWTLDEDTGLFKQQVDLGPEITALLGDPDAELTDEVELRVTLQAAQPGVLLLSIPSPSDAGTADAIRHRVLGSVDPARRELVFEAEGLRTVPVSLPSWVGRVESLEVRLSGDPEPERIVPPLGPAFPMAPGTAEPRVEMLLDSNRAAAVRLPDLQGIESLTALRLPLRTADGDAEVQVLLLEDAGLEPGPAIEGGVSEPSTVSAADHDTWHTFTFPEPVTVDPANPPLAAIAVSRGTAAWALTNDPTAGDVWQGPITGPWLPLPPLRMGAPRGRVRVVGLAAADAEPLAPLLVGLSADAALTVTPTPEGTVREIRPAGAAPAGGSVELALIARALGSVRVDELVVVVTKS